MADRWQAAIAGSVGVPEKDRQLVLPAFFKGYR
jgi:hypothetical protein